MKAVVLQSNNLVSMVDHPKPTILQPGDAIIRITSAALCGNDLYALHHEFSRLQKGDILGREAMGIIDSIGPDVQQFKVGDKVVISSVLSDGTCKYCKQGWTDCCETNNNRNDVSSWQHNQEGVLAEYTRVPFADYNLLRVPHYLPDERVLFLSESLTAAWHACENAGIESGKTKSIAIWGCGPVGLFAIMCIRGVRAPDSQIIAIDTVQDRLDMATKLGANICLNSKQDGVLDRFIQLNRDSIDVCIDAVGIKHTEHGTLFGGGRRHSESYPSTFLQRVEHAFGMDRRSSISSIISEPGNENEQEEETSHEKKSPSTTSISSSQVIAQCIAAVKKHGTVSVIGDYNRSLNHFPMDELFNKSITLVSGITPVQRYWRQLLEYVDQGLIDTSPLVTHYFSLDRSDEAFHMFDNKDHGSIKILIQPTMPFSTS